MMRVWLVALVLLLAGCDAGKIAGYPDTNSTTERFQCPAGQYFSSTDSGIPICRYN